MKYNRIKLYLHRHRFVLGKTRIIVFLAVYYAYMIWEVYKLLNLSDSDLNAAEQTTVIAIYFTFMVLVTFGYGKSWQKIIQKQANAKRSIPEYGVYITPQARDFLFATMHRN